MAKIKVDGWRCDRCGYEWAPRHLGDEPQTCPKCKSPYWNKPYQSEAFEAAGKARRSAASAAAVPKSLAKPPKSATKAKKKP